MNDDERREYEREVIESFAAAAADRLWELFSLTTRSIESLGVFRCFPVPDAGYTNGVHDPNSEFVVDAWELVVHEELTELVGGPDDGACVWSGACADLEPLIDALSQDDRPARIHFVSEPGLTDYHQVPHVSVSGRYKGLTVSVVILAYPPPDEPPAMRLDQEGQFWEIRGNEEE